MEKDDVPILMDDRDKVNFGFPLYLSFSFHQKEGRGDGIFQGERPTFVVKPSDDEDVVEVFKSMRARVKHSNQRVAIFGVTKEIMNSEERLLRLADHASSTLHSEFVRKRSQNYNPIFNLTILLNNICNKIRSFFGTSRCLHEKLSLLSKQKEVSLNDLSFIHKGYRDRLQHSRGYAIPIFYIVHPELSCGDFLRREEHLSIPRLS